jgi:glucosyl-3-phosphoglycerate synthase
VTLAAVGHDEAPTLQVALGQLTEAARDGDVALFLDSASTDTSVEIARAFGVEVVAAPLGKGAAVRHLLEQLRTDWLVIVDADIHGSEHNLAKVLRRAVDDDLSTVVGQFVDRPSGGILSNTWGIYEPLVAALFPEADGQFGDKPLTGFRAINRSCIGDLGDVPDDFGLEAHLNLAAALSGRPWKVVDLGWYEGRFLYKPVMGREIGDAVLAAAVRSGRLSSFELPKWTAWVEGVVEVVATFRGEPSEREDFLRRLAKARHRPLPDRSGPAAR